MKKILALLAALIMMFSLTACGGDKAEEAKKTENTSTTSNSANVENNESNKTVSALEITNIKIGNATYGEDGAITLNATVEWKGNPADDAWIGIIPADVPHGDEEKNDDYDVAYRYLRYLKSGTEFTFNAVTLEAGKYTVRVNESDSGGKELAWCGFEVSQLGKVKVDDPKVTILSKLSEGEDKGNTEAVTPTIPDGYDKCVNQGAVILYPTDKYQKSFMGGIEKIEGEVPWVRLSISADSFDKRKTLCEQEHGSSSDYSLTEITVGGHKALKCIYSDMTSYFMEVIIDTSFINDQFWSSISVKVDIPKTKGDLSVFEDETLWEIINSFYFDKALKYNY